MATSANRRSDRLSPTQARAARRGRRNRRRRVVRWGGGGAIGLLAFLFIVALFAPSLQFSIGSTGAGTAGTSVPDQGGGNLHMPRGDEHPPYNSVPGTSGWHYSDSGAPIAWGIYNEFIPDEVLVHNLEHGGVGIHYNCPTAAPAATTTATDPDGCDFLIRQLESLARQVEGNWLDKYILELELDPEASDSDLLRARQMKRRYKVVMSPYPDMDSKIALTAWNFIDKLEEYDESRIQRFLLDHMGSPDAPEYFSP